MARDSRIDTHALDCATPTIRHLMKRTACKWRLISASINISHSAIIWDRSAFRPTPCPMRSSATVPNGPVNGNRAGTTLTITTSVRGSRWRTAPRTGVVCCKRFLATAASFRAGGAMLYDRFGSELITEFDQFGSFGLATTLNNPVSYTYSTSPRYNGTMPAFPAAPTTGFPYTPPDVNGIVGEFQGIYPDLKSPYSILLNASFARQIPAN